MEQEKEVAKRDTLRQESRERIGVRPVWRYKLKVVVGKEIWATKEFSGSSVFCQSYQKKGED